MSSVRPKRGAEERKQETLWEERVRDAGLGQGEGGTSNAAWPTHLQSAGDGGETAPAGRLAEGKVFLLTLAVTAFPWLTDIPLKSSVSPLHTLVRSRGCRTSPCGHSGISARLWEPALLSSCLTPPQEHIGGKSWLRSEESTGISRSLWRELEGALTCLGGAGEGD